MSKYQTQPVAACRGIETRKIHNNAARERSRVRTLRAAFLQLQRTLPAVPPDTKLSKLDVLVLATAYICHLTQTLHQRSHAVLLCHCNIDRQQISTGLKASPNNLSTCNCNTARVVNNMLTLSSTLPKEEMSTSEINDSSMKQVAIGHRWHQRNSMRKNNSSTDCETIEGRRWDEKKSGLCHSASKRDKRLGIHCREVRSRSTVAAQDIDTTMNELAGYSAGSSSKIMAILHPVKKWPMRSRLYKSILSNMPLASISSTSSQE